MVIKVSAFSMVLPAIPFRLIITVCLAFCICSCTYLKYSFVQAEYARIQNAEPGQLNVKHMIDRESYFVHGRSVDITGNYAGLPKAIAAFSSKYQTNERVDTMYFEVAGSHFGLNLPEGHYDLLVFADIDGNGAFGSSEVVGKQSIELNNSIVTEKVLGHEQKRQESCSRDPPPGHRTLLAPVRGKMRDRTCLTLRSYYRILSRRTSE